MPVTTPTARLIRKIRPKKRLRRSQVSSLRSTASVCITATRKQSPIVMGTKKKWKTVTIANCQRARSRVMPRPILRAGPTGRARVRLRGVGDTYWVRAPGRRRWRASMIGSRV